MILIDKTGVFNLENAVRGARNAMNSGAAHFRAGELMMVVQIAQTLLVLPATSRIDKAGRIEFPQSSHVIAGCVLAATLVE